jgi:hypothetical protein
MDTNMDFASALSMGQLGLLGFLAEEKEIDKSYNHNDSQYDQSDNHSGIVELQRFDLVIFT